jgi:hypothetical protein
MLQGVGKSWKIVQTLANKASTDEIISELFQLMSISWNKYQFLLYYLLLLFCNCTILSVDLIMSVQRVEQKEFRENSQDIAIDSQHEDANTISQSHKAPKL